MLGRLLLIEDDSSVREAATLVLEGAGFTVHAVADGAEGLRAFEASPEYDLVLLDLMLPSMNGFDVCREIRARTGTPIVMLTAKTDVADVVTGLELGADDYITKPFVPAELSARVRAVLRRAAHGPDDDSSVVRVRDITLDEGAFRAHRGAEELTLTSVEFRLLSQLMRSAGKVLTREMLLDTVWGYDYLGDSRLVDAAIKRLRDKLGQSAEDPEYVVTVRGVGYRFERG